MTQEQTVPPHLSGEGHPGFAGTAEAVEEAVRETVTAATTAFTEEVTEVGEGAQHSVESVARVFTSLNRWVRRNPLLVWTGCALAGLLLVRLLAGPRDRGG